ncbi:hypothetical protein SAMN05720354_11767 [Nitrosospira sp. Nsp1]|nr:hypothetical protein SAMN05720354_11767 [Nitrosospira sp. Nsp1]
MRAFACETMRRKRKTGTSCLFPVQLALEGMFETVLILNEPADRVAVIGLVGEQRTGRFALSSAILLRSEGNEAACFSPSVTAWRLLRLSRLTPAARPRKLFHPFNSRGSYGRAPLSAPAFMYDNERTSNQLTHTILALVFAPNERWSNIPMERIRS